MWRTYKIREPGPYWPDTGQAHTTCKPLLVALDAGGGRDELEERLEYSRIAVCIDEVGDIAGIPLLRYQIR